MLNELSLKDSSQLKGIALILLLLHHLFYLPNGLYDDVSIQNIGLIETMGQICKVCVALFVFLSGYGLMVSSGKLTSFNSRSFYIKGLTKLYLNYWFIWLLFVPLGVFVFGRTFEGVYHDHVVLRWLIDFFGFSDAFGYYGYNVTWWFYSCILILYLLFPLIRFFMRSKYAIGVILVTFILMRSVYIPFFEPIQYYLFVFTLGMYFAEKHILSCVRFKYQWVLFLLIFFILCVWRQFGYKLTGIFVDPWLALCIVMMFNSLKPVGKRIGSFLHFLGEHSFNIFLFHTFIFYYYFQDYIYYFRNPFLIFFTLLGVCLLLSVFIEYLKRRVGFYRLQELIVCKLSAKRH